MKEAMVVMVVVRSQIFGLVRFIGYGRCCLLVTYGI
jgi:hypothetical protein